MDTKTRFARIRIDAAKAAALATSALATADPIEHALAVRALVETFGSGSSESGNVYAIALYQAQRSICGCGESFSQRADARAHLAGNEGHSLVREGTTYAALSDAVGVNEARVQQLISKGRQLVEGNGDAEAGS